jgi:hypothetical protein
MGIYRGPGIITKDLVFGYDTGYGVADNETSTRFYPGESTDNKLRLFTGGNKSLSYGSNLYIVTAQETNVSDVTAPNGQYSRFTGNSDSANNQVFWSYGGNSNDYTGSTVTFSTYLKGSGTCHLTTYDNQSGYGTSNTITLSDKWVRYSYTRAISGSATNHWSGVRGVLTGTNVYIAASQMEIKGHATPFTPTTRSSTQSLIDLKRTRDISVANISFPDSSGQPDFDGTDDFIAITDLLASQSIGSSTQLTISLWLNPDAHGSKMAFSTGQSGNDRIYYWMQSSLNTWRVGNYTSTTGHSTLPSIGEWYNTVLVINNNNITAYLNGVEDYTGTYTSFTTEHYATFGRHGATSAYYYNGNIGVAKIYEKALSAAEIEQDFKAYKNRFNL